MECGLYIGKLKKYIRNKDKKVIYWAHKKNESGILPDYEKLNSKGLRLLYLGSINNIIDIERIADVIKKLYDEGYEIFFATSSLPENLRKKINHLSRNMYLPKEYIERHTININDKYLLNVDILIDDCPEHIGNAKRNYYSIVFDYPWNRGDIDKQPCVSRVYDWLGVYTAVKTIESLIKESDDDVVTT